MAELVHRVSKQPVTGAASGFHDSWTGTYASISLLRSPDNAGSALLASHDAATGRQPRSSVLK